MFRELDALNIMQLFLKANVTDKYGSAFVGYYDISIPLSFFRSELVTTQQFYIVTRSNSKRYYAKLEGEKLIANTGLVDQDNKLPNSNAPTLFVYFCNKMKCNFPLILNSARISTTTSHNSLLFH